MCVRLADVEVIVLFGALHVCCVAYVWFGYSLLLLLRLLSLLWLFWFLSLAGVCGCHRHCSPCGYVVDVVVVDAAFVVVVMDFVVVVVVCYKPLLWW